MIRVFCVIKRIEILTDYLGVIKMSMKFDPSTGTMREVRDNGRTTTYPNGGVLWQPPGMSHKEYIQGVGNIKGINATNNNLLSRLTKK